MSETIDPKPAPVPTPSIESIDEQYHKMLDDTADRLSAHFDNVLILASYKCGEAPLWAEGRAGDYFALKGLAHTFLEDDCAEATASKAAEYIGEPSIGDDDDDDEDWKKKVT